MNKYSDTECQLDVQNALHSKNDKYIFFSGRLQSVTFYLPVGLSIYLFVCVYRSYLVHQL